MNPFSRRQFLATGAGALAATLATSPALAAYQKLKIGVTDWNLKHAAKPTSIEFARSIGFDGVEISLGRAKDHLPLGDKSLQDEYLAEMKKHNYPVAGTCLDILHQNYLKNDKLGQRWVAESIPITKRFGAKVILLPFFGNGELKTHAEMDYVGDFMKEIGPEAEKAGVILGLEDTITAEDNARILDRAQSRAVKVFYDVGNSFARQYDIYKEIRWLGKDRICEFHLKDNPRLMGSGLIDFEKVIQAIVDIDFAGWAHLETVAPSGDVKSDMTANLKFVRGILEKH
ncbi:MAG: sugar phosphate isomerase/epimerase family protein [Verrucomicrobiota bacterium]